MAGRETKRGGGGLAMGDLGVLFFLWMLLRISLAHGSGCGCLALPTPCPHVMRRIPPDFRARQQRMALGGTRQQES